MNCKREHTKDGLRCPGSCVVQAGELEDLRAENRSLKETVIKYRWLSADYEQRKIWIGKGHHLPAKCGVMELLPGNPNSFEGE